VLDSFCARSVAWELFSGFRCSTFYFEVAYRLLLLRFTQSLKEHPEKCQDSYHMANLNGNSTFQFKCFKIMSLDVLSASWDVCWVTENRRSGGGGASACRLLWVQITLVCEPVPSQGAFWEGTRRISFNTSGSERCCSSQVQQLFSFSWEDFLKEEK